MKLVTATEYAEAVGISKPAVMYRIKKKKVLPGVKDFRFDFDTKRYVFNFDEATTKEQAQKYFQSLVNFQS